jgi:GNAT superfamily N-acetyltransferase
VLSQNQVIQAIEANPAELWQLLAQHADGGVFETLSGATLISFPFPHKLFNSVLFASVTDSKAAVEEVSGFYRAKGRPWCWIVGPSSEPAALGKELLSAGLVHSHDTPGMAIDLTGFAAQCDARVVGVRDPAAYERWLQLLAKGFGMPEAAVQPFRELHMSLGWEDVPVRYFYALVDGEPAACSMNFYGAGVCGIYSVATAPEFRSRGLGAAVVNRCLSAAVEDGYDTAILHSSTMGRPLYEKLGFRELCQLAYFNPP